MIKPCPLTGLYFDDVLIESIVNSLKDGDTVEQALEHLAYITEKELDSEYNHYVSDEAIIETIECNEYKFLEDGTHDIHVY